MSNMLTTAALASAEAAINAALRYDPATRIGLAQLSGQILAVDITPPGLTLFVMLTDDGVRLMSQWDGDVDTRLRGSLLALVQLANTETHNLKDSGVDVTGKTALLVELQHLMKNLDIDWEEILSQFIGDIAGHQTAQLIRGKFSWAKQRTTNLQRLTSEFLTEELRVLPGKYELENFYQQVDALRLDADRVAARLEKLINKGW